MVRLLPVVVLVTLAAAALALGVSTVNGWFNPESVGAKVVALIGLVALGAYCLAFMITDDPFLLLRRRLWTRGELWIAVHDEEDPSEPFVWSSAPLPKGIDVSRDIEEL